MADLDKGGQKEDEEVYQSIFLLVRLCLRSRPWLLFRKFDTTFWGVATADFCFLRHNVMRPATSYNDNANCSWIIATGSAIVTVVQFNLAAIFDSNDTLTVGGMSYTGTNTGTLDGSTISSGTNIDFSTNADGVTSLTGFLVCLTGL